MTRAGLELEMYNYIDQGEITALRKKAGPHNLIGVSGFGCRTERSRETDRETGRQRDRQKARERERGNLWRLYWKSTSAPPITHY